MQTMWRACMGGPWPARRRLDGQWRRRRGPTDERMHGDDEQREWHARPLARHLGRAADRAGAPEDCQQKQCAGVVPLAAVPGRSAYLSNVAWWEEGRREGVACRLAGGGGFGHTNGRALALGAGRPAWAGRGHHRRRSRPTAGCARREHYPGRQGAVRGLGALCRRARLLHDSRVWQWRRVACLRVWRVAEWCRVVLCVCFWGCGAGEAVVRRPRDGGGVTKRKQREQRGVQTNVAASRWGGGGLAGGSARQARHACRGGAESDALNTRHACRGREGGRWGGSAQQTRAAVWVGGRRSMLVVAVTERRGMRARLQQPAARVVHRPSVIGNSPSPRSERRQAAR